MSIEGRLKIDLHRNGAKVGKAVITSSRPLRIARFFAGKSVNEMLQVMPLVFSVCAHAQSSAACLACEQAMGRAAHGDTRNGREMIVLAETAREHLLRIALDWPRYLSTSGNHPEVKSIMKLPNSMRRAVFTNGNAFEIGARPKADVEAVNGLMGDLRDFLKREIFGEDVAQWRRRADFDALKDWAGNASTIPARLIRDMINSGWMRAGHADVEFLPAISDREMLARLGMDDADAFAARPSWNDTPRETSALSRQRHTSLIENLVKECGNGLLTRLAARLCELAALPDEILCRLDACPDTLPAGKSSPQNGGAGLAQIEAARGRLVHMAQIEQGIVRRYCILAPTEWNFHPRGPAAQSLAQLDAANEDELKKKAALLITAIDPCVGFEVRVH